MKDSSPRKLTRFFIINPVGDRRLEKRFESREDVVVRVQPEGRVFPSVALEVGQYGMRLESKEALEVGMGLEIAFPRGRDNINCFGRVAWIYKTPQGAGMVGVAVEAWHGIVSGSASWMKFKGTVAKTDRRQRDR